jgi:hypothetical protein
MRGTIGLAGVACALIVSCGGPTTNTASETPTPERAYCTGLTDAVEVRDRLRGGLDTDQDALASLTEIQARVETAQDAVEAKGGFAAPEGQTAGAKRIADARRYLSEPEGPPSELERQVGVTITNSELAVQALGSVEDLHDELTYCISS